MKQDSLLSDISGRKEPRLSLKLPLGVGWVPRICNTAGGLVGNSIRSSDPLQVAIGGVRVQLPRANNSRDQGKF